MNEYDLDITNIPHRITYNEILSGMREQMTDKFLYLSLIVLAFILLNMFVFKENARYRNLFDKLDKENIEKIGSLRDLTYQIVQTIALVASLMLVMMNIIYRTGLKI